jgi:hypothetical protein
MNMNRVQSDGKVRDSDNWQKGMPMDVYMKSGYRHFMEWWIEHRKGDDMSNPNAMVAGLCGLMFNVMGYLHEWLKKHPEIKFDDGEPTPEMADRLRKIEKENSRVSKEAEELIQFMCPSCGCMPCRCNPSDVPYDITKLEPLEATPIDWKECDPPEDEDAMIECDDCGEIYGGSEDHSCSAYLYEDEPYCDNCGWQECTCDQPDECETCEHVEPLCCDCTKHTGKYEEGVDYKFPIDDRPCTTCRYEKYEMLSEPCRSCLQKQAMMGEEHTLWLPKEPTCG